jgi:hypothetical protein
MVAAPVWYGYQGFEDPRRREMGQRGKVDVRQRARDEVSEGAMKAGQLKKLLAYVPDDAELLAPAFDHSYTPIGAQYMSVVVEGRGEWAEDFGPKYDDHYQKGFTRVKALVFGGN